MVGFCGFLSFSLVFCLLGGRFETTLYIHFTRRWVKSKRHSSAPRISGRGRKDGKGTPFFAVGLCGVGLPAGQARLTVSALPGPAPSGRGRTPRLSQPPLRLVYAGRETEQADALCLHKCAAVCTHCGLVVDGIVGTGPGCACLIRRNASGRG